MTFRAQRLRKWSTGTPGRCTAAAACILDSLGELARMKDERLGVDVADEVVVLRRIVFVAKGNRLAEREARVRERQAVLARAVQQDGLGNEPASIDLGDPRLAVLVRLQIDTEGSRRLRIHRSYRAGAGFYDTRLVHGLRQSGHRRASTRLTLGEEVREPLARLREHHAAVLPEHQTGEVATGQVLGEREIRRAHAPHLAPVPDPAARLLRRGDWRGASRVAPGTNAAPERCPRGEAPKDRVDASTTRHGVCARDRDSATLQECREPLLVLAEVDDVVTREEDASTEPPSGGRHGGHALVGIRQHYVDGLAGNKTAKRGRIAGSVWRRNQPACIGSGILEEELIPVAAKD